MQLNLPRSVKFKPDQFGDVEVVDLLAVLVAISCGAHFGRRQEIESLVIPKHPCTNPGI